MIHYTELRAEQDRQRDRAAMGTPPRPAPPRGPRRLARLRAALAGAVGAGAGPSAGAPREERGRPAAATAPCAGD